MYVGKTLFAQVMEFVPWTSFARIVHRYRGNAGVRALSCAEQFRAMAFAQLTWRESLRDIEVSLSANASKLYAMGFRVAVKRSTLADANESRDWRIWFDLAALLIRRARKLYASDSLGVELDNTVYALDSTTIDLCLSLFDWAPFRSTKAAIKLHTLLDLRGSIPAFIHISDGKLHDVNVLDMLSLEAGAFYVMDRGYVDFERLYTLHQAGAFFVTRAKSPMDARRVYSAPVDRDTGVICDQRVMLNGYYSAKKYPEHLRRIRFKDPESGKTLVFLTNNTALPALTICALYKSRWQVELFFKWIKQHLRIKKFLGTSENAVKTQVWCAVATYVLIAIVKKELQLNASLYTCLQILSVSVFEKTQLSCALQPDNSGTELPTDTNQLILFNF
ncbi:IS4 family transposase [Polaromonas sp. AET17H-212]|uniref:IS4 family transposase n=1 Tax=Polaromonas sp. AET17H-212 TaxID=1977061 RepID=UPI0011446225|nr:IS4 family transposase [Polaromonas sp. AET17H-212]